MNDIVCTCKHDKKDHASDTSIGASLKHTCWYCAIVGDWCEDYTPDNLSHIEQLARKKKLI